MFQRVRLTQEHHTPIDKQQNSDYKLCAMKCETGHPITETIKKLVRGMCHNLEQLEIEDHFESGKLTITMTPHADDYRIICGTKGGRINALKLLVKMGGDVARIKTDIRLISSGKGERSPNNDVFVGQPDFDKDGLNELVHEICDMAGIYGGIELEEDDSTHRTTIEIASSNPEEDLAVHGLRELLYSYGFKNGRKIEVKTQ